MLDQLRPSQLYNSLMGVFQHISLGSLVEAAVIVLFFTLLSRGLTSMFNSLSARSGRGRSLAQTFQPLLQTALWLIAALLCVNVLAPTQDTLLFALATLVILIGLGSQDLVKNWAGGLIVLSEQPYRIGDRVRIGPAYGEIVHIGLRSTRLLSVNGDMVTIPNSVIWNDQVSNLNYGAQECMTVTDLYFPIDAPVNELLSIAGEAAATSPFRYLPQPIQVDVDDQLNETPQMRIRIRAFVYHHRLEFAMMTDINSRIKRELERRGIAYAYHEAESLPT